MNFGRVLLAACGAAALMVAVQGQALAATEAEQITALCVKETSGGTLPADQVQSQCSCQVTHLVGAVDAETIRVFAAASVIAVTFPNDGAEHDAELMSQLAAQGITEAQFTAATTNFGNAMEGAIAACPMAPAQ